MVDCPYEELETVPWAQVTTGRERRRMRRDGFCLPASVMLPLAVRSSSPIQTQDQRTFYPFCSKRWHFASTLILARKVSCNVLGPLEQLPPPMPMTVSHSCPLMVFGTAQGTGVKAFYVVFFVFLSSVPPCSQCLSWWRPAARPPSCRVPRPLPPACS